MASREVLYARLFANTVGLVLVGRVWAMAARQATITNTTDQNFMAKMNLYQSKTNEKATGPASVSRWGEIDRLAQKKIRGKPSSILCIYTWGSCITELVAGGGITDLTDGNH